MPFAFSQNLGLLCLNQTLGFQSMNVFHDGVPGELAGGTDFPKAGKTGVIRAILTTDQIGIHRNLTGRKIQLKYGVGNEKKPSLGWIE